MDSTRKIIEYWYKKLSFDSKYDDDFYCALKEIEIPAESSVDNFVYDENNGAKNFLSFLYFCENLKNEYANKGIDEAILYDTLSDIPIWLDTWSAIKGTMFLGETDWLKRHLGMKLIKLGRLQFCMAGAEHAIPDMNIKENDDVSREDIDTLECTSSFSKKIKDRIQSGGHFYESLGTIDK